MNKLRVFIALPASPPLQRLIGAWQAGSRLPIRWLAPAGCHVTLVPPRYAGEAGLAALAALGNSLRGEIKPFTLHFDMITFGPDRKRPRLVWAAGERAPELEKLQGLLAAGLGEPGTRDFLPHLTLGRFRPEDFRRLPVKELDQPIDWLEPVTAFSLFRSDLSAQGARYTVLKNFEL
ncbi:MAG: RNA 2',3'-cyclic phosphodiesterase [Candidatus Saganbacteria bacterium]|nr:RNA 2',3'-cyclic phosphodiesterase [Candidatus Saganbacteria bacterium]